MKRELSKNLLKAKKAYQNKEYLEAYNLYKNEYDENPEQFNIWDKRFFSWSIYRTFVKEFDYENLDKIELIFELVPQEDNSKKDGASATALTAMTIADYFFEDENYFDVVEWLNKINPLFLYEFNEEEAKGVRYSSKREKYYTLKSKSLINLGEYEETIKVCEEALSNLSYPTGGIWFKRRIAQSYHELLEYDKALEILKEVFKNKKDWYIQKEISDNYYFMGDLDNSLKYAIEAALNFGDIDKKVNLYVLIGDLLEEKGETEKAIKHYQLAYAIRLHNDWGISDDLLEKLEDTDINLDDDNYWKIEKELRGEWESLKYSNQSRIYGTIRTIFPHGKSGFIEGQDYNSYYFEKRSVNGDKSKLDIGKLVSFFTEEGFDKKKGKKTINAVSINIEE